MNGWGEGGGPGARIWLRHLAVPGEEETLERRPAC